MGETSLCWTCSNKASTQVWSSSHASKRCTATDALCKQRTCPVANARMQRHGLLSAPATSACVTGCECQLDSNRLTFCTSSTPAAIVMYLLCSVVAVIHDGLSVSTNSLKSICWVGICAHLPARLAPQVAVSCCPFYYFQTLVPASGPQRHQDLPTWCLF